MKEIRLLNNSRALKCKLLEQRRMRLKQYHRLFCVISYIDMHFHLCHYKNQLNLTESLTKKEYLKKHPLVL